MNNEGKGVDSSGFEPEAFCLQDRRDAFISTSPKKIVDQPGFEPGDYPMPRDCDTVVATGPFYAEGET